MKRQKRYLGIAVVLSSLVLSGCGTSLYEMTQEEEDYIVHAAAYYVAKHNIQQKDGASAVVDPDSIVLEPETEPIENVIEENTEENGEVLTPSDGDVQGELIADGTVSLADAMGAKGALSVTYTGSYTAENYVEGSAYSLDANKGKVFYVMEFAMENTSENAIEVDNASKNFMFQLIDKDVNVSAEMTFLMTDFSTYQGTIAAGETVKAILLFEVSESVVEKITSPSLQITIDNKTKSVKL